MLNSLSRQRRPPAVVLTCVLNSADNGAHLRWCCPGRRNSVPRPHTQSANKARHVPRIEGHSRCDCCCLCTILRRRWTLTATAAKRVPMSHCNYRFRYEASVTVDVDCSYRRRIKPPRLPLLQMTLIVRSRLLCADQRAAKHLSRLVSTPSIRHKQPCRER